MPGLGPLSGQLGPLGRASGARSSLLDNLVSWWPLDGNPNDSHGTNHLTNNNSVTFPAGKVGQAASIAVSNQSLSIADNAALSMGDIDFTIACWVNLTDKSTIRSILSKHENSTAREYRLLYNNGTDNFELRVSANGTTEITIRATTLGSPSTGVWYFIVAWHDSILNQIGIQANNGTANTAAHTTGVIDLASAFRIGAIGTGSFLNGLVDNAAIWKRLLTATEKAELYAGGAGIAYPG